MKVKTCDRCNKCIIGEPFYTGEEEILCEKCYEIDACNQCENNISEII